MKNLKSISNQDAVNYLKELCINHKHNQVLDDCINSLSEVGYFIKNPKTKTSQFINTFTVKSVKAHYEKIINSYN